MPGVFEYSNCKYLKRKFFIKKGKGRRRTFDASAINLYPLTVFWENYSDRGTPKSDKTETRIDQFWIDEHNINIKCNDITMLINFTLNTHFDNKVCNK